MEAAIITRQSLEVLLEEIDQYLENLDILYKDMVDCLNNLNPHLNFKKEITLGSEAGKISLEALTTATQKFKQRVELLFLAGEDLANDLQSLLIGRHAQDLLYQEVARQAGFLAQEIDQRQQIAKIFLELQSLLEKAATQDSLNPQQQKKIEDAVFQLSLLESPASVG